jgi:uncharacterized protein YcnI
MTRLRRATLASAAALAVFAIASPAWAHVTVTAPGAAPGASDVEITFRVPNELRAARTTQLSVQFPLDTPIADVLVQPTPGWSFTEKTAKLAKPIVTDDGDVTEAVSQIDWHATGSGIAAGEFGAFTVIAGQLPDAKSLTFKAIQTYSNGTKVSWIEVPAPGSSADPDHPAPVLTLSAPSTATTVTTAKKSSSSSGVAFAALVVACVGTVLAGAAFQQFPSPKLINNYSHLTHLSTGARTMSGDIYATLIAVRSRET